MKTRFHYCIRCHQLEHGHPGFTLLDFIENGHLNGKSIQVGNENAFITRAEILDSQASTLSNAITLSPGETNATIALDVESQAVAKLSKTPVWMFKPCHVLNQYR